jgi:hypothetical protein
MAQDLIRCFPSMERFERGLTTSQRVVWDGLFYEEKKVLYEGILDAIKEHEARVIRRLEFREDMGK